MFKKNESSIEPVRIYSIRQYFKLMSSFHNVVANCRSIVVLIPPRELRCFCKFMCSTVSGKATNFGWCVHSNSNHLIVSGSILYIDIQREWRSRPKPIQVRQVTCYNALLDIQYNRYPNTSFDMQETTLNKVPWNKHSKL